MAINAQIQNGSHLVRLARLNTQTVVEIKFSGEEGEALAVYPQISLSSCEISSGRVNFGGRIICTAVMQEGGKLCRVQKGAEFTHYIDDERLAPAQSGECTLTVLRCQIKRDGSAFCASVVVGAEIEVYDSVQRCYVTDIGGAICKTDSGRLYNKVCFSGESQVDDAFDCMAADVLVPCCKAHVTQCNVKAGFVEVCGEIYLSILAVREGSPVSLDRVVPFKCELACDEALFNQKGYCRAEVSAVTVNCKVNEDKGVCDVEFTATLAFSGHFYEEEEITFTADAFSEECRLNTEFNTESTFIDTDIKNYTERVQGACAVKAKIDYTCAFLSTALPCAEFVRTADGIEGSVTATLLYEQGGELRSTEVNLPFSIPLSGLSQQCTDLSVAVLGISLRQRAEGECEGEAVLKICGADGETKQITYISGVQEGEKRQADSSAVSVYVTQEGDGLWETAKRLCASPESIKKSNPELTFPLTGKERILIYRTKQY